jgi:hypothetical protein
MIGHEYIGSYVIPKIKVKLKVKGSNCEFGLLNGWEVGYNFENPSNTTWY